MRIVISALLGASSLIACHPFYGFIESELRLADDSRLPRWFTVPSGYAREDINTTITYYTLGRAEVVMYGPNPENKKLWKGIVEDRWHPCSQKQFDEQKTGAVYPNYSVIKFDNIEEILEQREPGDILYITDDSQLRRTMDKC
jgi:hypothetical protein